MINISENIINMLNAPARRIQARVELYECSTLQNDDYNRVLLQTFPNDGALKEFKVERITEDGKFFGFGVSQKLTVKLRDKERAINIVRGQVLEISFGIDNDFTYPCPLFRVEEVSRDENNNDLTISAYDFLYKAGEHRVSELGLTNYTIRTFVYACADVLNLPVKFDIDDSAFDQPYPTGANFEGTETLREALNGVAEATQTIFFVDWDWRLTFKRLDRDGDPVFHIDKSKYYELKNKSDRTLTTICHATELGDNVEATTGGPGVVQYVRNNPFWELREDIDTILTNALAAIAGITISQFDCSWRGNFALEIGDKISITTKDNGVLVGYVLNDTLTYNGGLKEQTFWNFTEHTAETASNPISLGEALRQTYARVDKANKTIELHVSETNEKVDGLTTTLNEAVAEITLTTDAITSRVEANETNISELGTTIDEKMAEVKITTDAITNRVEATETSIGELETTVNEKLAEWVVSTEGIVGRVEATESRLDANDTAIEIINQQIATLEVGTSAISAEVSRVEQVINETTEGISEEIATLTKSVEAAITAEDMTIAINSALSNGIEADAITTTTGFTFNEVGLTVSKSGNEMTTTITENGMTVYKDSTAVLTANNKGVNARDLKAENYLIIGNNSRFEDYNGNRTGCFWIGGN